VHMGWTYRKASDWMTTENPNFGNATPHHLFMVGRSHKVLAFIEQAMSDERRD